MGRRHALSGSALIFVTCGIACVDLFHGTDFDTLCTISPTNPRCGVDAATTPDVLAPDTSGPDAPVPHPDFCSWDSARAKAEAAHACAWLGACEGPIGESAFGPCMVRAQLAFDCTANKMLRPGGATDEFWSCLSTVGSCAEVDGCAFPSGALETCGQLQVMRECEPEHAHPVRRARVGPWRRSHARCAARRARPMVRAPQPAPAPRVTARRTPSRALPRSAGARWPGPARRSRTTKASTAPPRARPARSRAASPRVPRA